MHGYSTLKSAQTQLCRPSGYGDYRLLIPYSRSSFELLLGKAISDAGGRATYFATSFYQVSSVTDVRCPDHGGTRHNRFLCILHDRYLVSIALESLEKKKSIHCGPLTHPLPSLACRPPGLPWLHPVTPNYSNCISYNFFIFCPICLEFSHKFLHTYCFILCIQKKNREYA